MNAHKKSWKLTKKNWEKNKLKKYIPQKYLNYIYDLKPTLCSNIKGYTTCHLKSN